MSRLCRLKSYKGIGEDGRWAYDEIVRLRSDLATSEEKVKQLNSLCEFNEKTMTHILDVVYNIIDDAKLTSSQYELLRQSVVLLENSGCKSTKYG